MKIMARNRSTTWKAKLKKLRRSLGFKQHEMAADAGFATQTWTNWENGQQPGPLAIRLLQAKYPELR
jgi:DNA-binding XRE family transcriptional regulator